MLRQISFLVSICRCVPFSNDYSVLCYLLSLLALQLVFASVFCFSYEESTRLCARFSGLLLCEVSGLFLLLNNSKLFHGKHCSVCTFVSEILFQKLNSNFYFNPLYL